MNSERECFKAGRNETQKFITNNFKNTHILKNCKIEAAKTISYQLTPSNKLINSESKLACH